MAVHSLVIILVFSKWQLYSW